MDGLFRPSLNLGLVIYRFLTLSLFFDLDWGLSHHGAGKIGGLSSGSSLISSFLDL